MRTTATLVAASLFASGCAGSPLTQEEMLTPAVRDYAAKNGCVPDTVRVDRVFMQAGAALSAYQVECRSPHGQYRRFVWWWGVPFTPAEGYISP